MSERARPKANDPGAIPDVVQLTRELVDVPSITGEEGPVGDLLFDLLEEAGWSCLKQPVEGDRFNVVAARGRPKVVLTTHIDTVPPYFPSDEDEEHVYGRGACDAKGIAAAMLRAGVELASQGEERVGLLFVVGEETDSAGARMAAQLELECDYVIDGEPTDNVLVTAHKGSLAARLRARGRTAHSAYPELGESAVEKLLDVLQEIRAIAWPEDDELGPSLLNIGTLRGGRAGNVIPDQAEALLILRLVRDPDYYTRRLKEVVSDRVELEIVGLSEPQRMVRVPGWPSKVVGYGTDIPSLRSLGKPLLLGPGSIFDAHTAREKISKKQLQEAVGLYRRLVQELLAGKAA